jgi:hypothetical protein
VRSATGLRIVVIVLGVLYLVNNLFILGEDVGEAFKYNFGITFFDEILDADFIDGRQKVFFLLDFLCTYLVIAAIVLALATSARPSGRPTPYGPQPYGGPTQLYGTAPQQFGAPPPPYGAPRPFGQPTPPYSQPPSGSPPDPGGPPPPSFGQ